MTVDDGAGTTVGSIDPDGTVNLAADVSLVVSGRILGSPTTCSFLAQDVQLTSSLPFDGALVRSTISATDFDIDLVTELVACNIMATLVGTSGDAEFLLFRDVAPSAPRNVTLTPRNASLRVAWSAPASDGSASVINYQVQVRPAGGSFAAAGTSTSSPFTITGLTNGRSYTVRVRAVNNAGPGSVVDAPHRHTVHHARSTALGLLRDPSGRQPSGDMGRAGVQRRIADHRLPRRRGPRHRRMPGRPGERSCRITRTRDRPGVHRRGERSEPGRPRPDRHRRAVAASVSRPRSAARAGSLSGRATRFADVILSDRPSANSWALAASSSSRSTSGCVQPSSVDVKLANLFRVFRNHTAGIIDVKQDMTGLTELVEIPADGVFMLHPGEFVLGSTLERIGVPDDLVARIEASPASVAWGCSSTRPPASSTPASTDTSRWSWPTWPACRSRSTRG